MKSKVLNTLHYVILFIIYMFIVGVSNGISQSTTFTMQVRAYVVNPMPVDVIIYNSQTDTLKYEPTIAIPIENTPYSIQLTETKWNTSSYYIDRNNKHETCSITICYL